MDTPTPISSRRRDEHQATESPRATLASGVAVRTVDLRIAALRRFAVAITILNILGQTVLGFEMSLAQVTTSLVTAYGLELLLEWIQSRVEHRSPRFAGNIMKLVDFLLPAHITGLAVSMLMFANDRLLPFAFGAAVAIGSKAILRAPTPKGPRHFMNPSNFGLAVTYVAFSDRVATVVPYQYTGELDGYWEWILPLLVLCAGSLLNARFTRRLPLILAWVGGFVLQAIARHFLFGAALWPTLAPITGFAFILFTFYMVTDPGTTPSKAGRQVAFGLSVAAAYGLLISWHVPFALFFALTPVCLCRGIGLYVTHSLTRKAQACNSLPASPFHADIRADDCQPELPRKPVAKRF